MGYKRYTEAIERFYRKIDEMLFDINKHNRKIVMFGTGIPSNMAIKYLETKHIITEAVVDNNKAKVGTEFCGVKVYLPEEYLKDFRDDIVVFITSNYQDEMIEQLQKMGYKQGKHIIVLLDLKESTRDYKLFGHNGLEQMSDRELRKQQIRILRHLKKVCEENELRYWLCGGTLLGAIRHKGYIPWDDDIDVFVEYKDLKKLATILKKDNDFSLASFVDETCDIASTCSYMYSENTLMDRNHFPQQTSFGVSIDIFALPGVPTNDKEFYEYFKRLNELNEKMWGSVYDKKSVRKVLNEISEFMEKYDFDECDSCGYLLTRFGEKEKMNTSDFKENVKVMFEGEEYNSPADWNKYLTTLYGNYMEFPPEDKRVSTHYFKAYKTENSTSVE